MSPRLKDDIAFVMGAGCVGEGWGQDSIDGMIARRDAVVPMGKPRSGVVWLRSETLVMFQR